MMDYYSAMFESAPDLNAPRFEPCESDAETGIASTPNTILIAPYTTGNAKYSPGADWWERLVDGLRGGESNYDETTVKILAAVGVNKSYIIKTNGEISIKGTEPILIPYKNLVPYLNQCHAFIAARSGLCEIVSSAGCIKVIIYSRKSEWYPEGMMKSYTGLGGMRLSDDAVELLWELLPT
jgi:hypothetical protein